MKKHVLGNLRTPMERGDQTLVLMMFKARANKRHVKLIKETTLDDTDSRYDFEKIMLVQSNFKYE